MYMGKKSSLKDKELTKLKKLIKKLKEAKKTRRKRKRDEGITQKVSQKVIIGNLKEEKKGATEYVGRSFPQIQFIPQTQSQSIDTLLLRDLLLQKNMSPLTRPVESRVPYRQLYDLGDQYGLNVGNPVSLGIPLDIQSEISSLTDVESYVSPENIANEESTPLQPPPEKQSNLDEPIEEPKPINLGKVQSKITSFYQPKTPEEEMTKITDLSSKQQLTKTTEDIFNEPEDVSKAETVTKIKEKKKKKKKNIEFIIENPEEMETINLPEEIEIEMKAIPKKKKGRPKGSKDKQKINLQEDYMRMKEEGL